MMRALVALLVLAAPVAAGATTRLVIDDEAVDASAPLGAWTGKRPSLADVDLDGDLDLLEQNANGRVYVLDVRTGRALVEVEPSYPYGPDLGPFNGPKAADLDGDGVVELVNVNRAAMVSVWSLVPKEDGLDATLSWERHLDDHHGKPSADAGPVLGDLDGDGRFEIVVQTEETGAYALHHDGSVLWSLPRYGGNAEAVLADVDGDADLDAVFFTDGGVAYAVDGPTGAELWAFHADHHGVWPGSAPSPGVVTDLDGDGRVEVAFCARNVEDATPEHAPGAPWYRQHHFVLFALRDGKLLWKAKPEWGNPLCSAYLLAFDHDGDGRKEIYGMDWNTIGHKPGDWERTGDPHAFAYDARGRELWHRTLDAFNAKPAIAAGDWDGDGDDDLVAYGRTSLDVLDAANGERVARHRLPGPVKQGPLLADLDADGALDAVVATSAPDAFVVIETGTPFRAPAAPAWEPPVPAPLRPAATPEPAPPLPTAVDAAPAGAVDAGALEAPTPGRHETAAPGLLALLAVLLLAARRRHA